MCPFLGVNGVDRNVEMGIRFFSRTPTSTTYRRRFATLPHACRKLTLF